MANTARLKEGVITRGSSRGRLWSCRGGVVVVATVVLVLAVTGVTHHYSEHLMRSLEGPMPADDPELLRYIRQELLSPPSHEPYNLLGENNIAEKTPENSEIFYNKTIRGLFQDKRGGFFVEAGALDGETMSNTLWLERQLGWTGLLVEADHTSYLSLLTKHRQAWTANVCLSPTPYPSKEMFSMSARYSDPWTVYLGLKTRAMNGLTSFNTKAMSSSWFSKVQCVPLESLLLALGVTRVDLLVLDVEGAELAILEHLDLQKFDVQVLCVEWKKVKELDSVSQKFMERGYVEVARKSEDLILVRRGSEYEDRLKATPGS